jgi:hypothetical protein
MATRHATRFLRTGAQLLVREFGEMIVYYPGGSVDNARTIQAIVERTEELLDDQVAQAILCRVLDDTTLGIGSLEINDGRDQVAVAETTNGQLHRRFITRMTDDSNGMVRFKVR